MSAEIYDFVALSQVNVDKHIEKKGRFNYLTWTVAVEELLRRDPKATWEFDEPQIYNDTYMVFCKVNAFGKTMGMQLPVIQNNKAIKNPTSMDINTAMMRCLAKCIAVFGIGLYIYKGEDTLNIAIEDQVNNAYEDEGAEGVKKLFNTMSQRDRKEALPFVNSIMKKEEENGK